MTLINRSPQLVLAPLRLLVLVMAAIALGTIPTDAQEPGPHEACGSDCGSCAVGGLYKEGKNLVPHGASNAIYSMDCHIKGWFWDCNACGEEEQALVSDIAPSIAKTVAAILAAAAAPAELGEIVKTARNQMFVDVARNIIGFRGSGCATNSITTVIVVSPTKIGALRKLGVPPLSQIL